MIALPRMTTVGDGAFLADDTMVGTYELSGGWLHVAPARVGEQAFLNARRLPFEFKGGMAWLGKRAQIEAELSAGAFAKRIHSKYKDQLGFSYTQFLRYMQQYELQNPLQQCHASRRGAGTRVSSQVKSGGFPSPHRERPTTPNNQCC